MKYLFLFCLGLSILICNPAVCRAASDPVNPLTENKGNTINLVISPELQNLAADLTREYEKLNPGTKFLVRYIDGNDAGKPGTALMLTTHETASPSGFNINIGHNVIVPVMNAKNPMSGEIAHRGITSREFASLVAGGEKISWSDLIKNGPNQHVNVYMIDNNNLKTAISAFTHTSPDAISANLMTNTEDFTGAIQNDPYAIGFCRLSDITREGQERFAGNISLLPIDKNGNGRIDMFENIYNTPADLSRGVWLGKYPHALSGSIYAISESKPTDKNTMAFLAWIVTDGGKYLVSNGYGDLVSLEKRANLAALAEIPENNPAADAASSLSWLLPVILSVVAVLIILAFIVVFKGAKPEDTDETSIPVNAFNAKTIVSPKGLYYDKTHTWAFMEHDGNVRLGIDDFLLHVTGTITRITMKEPGEFVRRGEKIITLTKFGKQLSLYSPVSGTIKARNSRLDENSSLANKSPYAEGWVYLVEPKNWTKGASVYVHGRKTHGVAARMNLCASGISLRAQ